MLRPVFTMSLIFLSQHVIAGQVRCDLLMKDQTIHSDRVLEPLSFVSGRGFIVPNEKEIGSLRQAFSKTPEGLYVTVGTERGFTSAAISSPQTKALVLVDRDLNVVTFNLMNKALLSLAKSREDYLRLRLTATFDEIQLALNQASAVSIENTNNLKNKKMWMWWQTHVQQSLAWSEFHRDPELNSTGAFKNGNYLFDEGLFAAISQLAKQNQIYVFHSDLGADYFKNRLTQLSNELKVKVSVLDLSNGWQEGYLGHQGTVDLVTRLQSYLMPSTNLVLSSLRAHPTIQGLTAFQYSVLSLSSLRSVSELYSIMANLARQEPSQKPQARSNRQRFGFDD
jgi:hypothetical protein